MTLELYNDRKDVPFYDWMVEKYGHEEYWTHLYGSVPGREPRTRLMEESPELRVRYITWNLLGEPSGPAFR